MELIEMLIDLISVEDIMNGFTYLEKDRKYICLICGETKDHDIIYNSKNGKNFINAQKAMEDHIETSHGGVFNYLINLDSNLVGLTNRQKEIYEILYKHKDNQEISNMMNTTPATVRSYKYKKREKVKQAKIFLALAYLIDQSEEGEPSKFLQILEDYREVREEDNRDYERASLINLTSKRNLDYIEEDKDE